MREGADALPARAARPGRIVVAAAVLAIDGIVWVLYGSAVPLFPGIADEPVSDVATFIGAVTAVTGLGVWRLQAWARIAGACLLGAFLIRDVAFTSAHVTGVDGMDIARLAGDAIWIAVDTVALFILVRRWPERATDQARPVDGGGPDGSRQ